MTGNVTDSNGRPWGWQITFFRQGLIPPREAESLSSAFLVRDVKFAHAAVSDLNGQRHFHHQTFARGAFGEAGFGDPSEGDPRLVWVEDWQLDRIGDHQLRVRASGPDFSFELELVAEKPPVFHGADGVSSKGDAPGRASHYFSLTRLRTTGTLTADGRSHEVQGWSWYDREWFTHQLTEGQTGWDWFSIQLEDQTELMLFRIRAQEGSDEAVFAGTYVDAGGASKPVETFSLTETAHWTSPETDGRYPVAWRLEIPGLDLVLDAKTNLPHQEMGGPTLVYWEGAMEFQGYRGDSPVVGRGYLEMTGYAGALRGLSAED